MGGRFSKPLGETRLRGGPGFELDQGVGRQLVFSHERILETGRFQLSPGLSLRGRIGQRSHQNAENAFFGSGSDDRVHDLLRQGFSYDLGIRTCGGHHLPIIAGRWFARYGGSL